MWGSLLKQALNQTVLKSPRSSNPTVDTLLNCQRLANVIRCLIIRMYGRPGSTFILCDDSLRKMTTSDFDKGSLHSSCSLDSFEGT